MRLDGVFIPHAEAMKLSKELNTWTAMVIEDMSLAYTTKKLVHYAGTFKLEYGVTFVYVRFVDKMQSSDIPPTRSCGTYSR